MQTEIALLTTEAEYISLSQTMRDLIPLRHIILEVLSVFGMKCDSCNSYATTFQDKKGAIELAKNQNIYIEQNIFLSNDIILESTSKEIHQGLSVLKQMNNKPTS